MADPQVVLITGCSSGFGKLTALELARRGHIVYATMRDPGRRNAAAAGEVQFAGRSVSGEIRVRDMDVADSDSVRSCVNSVLVEAERIDAVVNNAGYGSGGLMETFEIEQFRAMFEVNVFGVHRVNRAVLPSMREREEGLLVHVSSVLGRVVMPFCGPYVASKFALEALAESYRHEVAPFGVDVVVVEPGGFGTGFGQQMRSPADEDRYASYGDLAEAPEKMWGEFQKRVTAKGAPDPQVVADAIADLVKKPAGSRPFRTVIDPLMGGAGADAINEVSQQVMEKVLAALGMADTLKLPGAR